MQYIEAWLRGRGAVPIYNLMEDAATAEISRAQIWQWIKYGAELDGGIKVTHRVFRARAQAGDAAVKREVGAANYAGAASRKRSSCFANCRSPRIRAVPHHPSL